MGCLGVPHWLRDARRGQSSQIAPRNPLPRHIFGPPDARLSRLCRPRRDRLRHSSACTSPASPDANSRVGAVRRLPFPIGRRRRCRWPGKQRATCLRIGAPVFERRGQSTDCPYADGGGGWRAQLQKHAHENPRLALARMPVIHDDCRAQHPSPPEGEGQDRQQAIQGEGLPPRIHRVS